MLNITLTAYTLTTNRVEVLSSKLLAINTGSTGIPAELLELTDSKYEPVQEIHYTTPTPEDVKEDPDHTTTVTVVFYTTTSHRRMVEGELENRCADAIAGELNGDDYAALIEDLSAKFHLEVVSIAEDSPSYSRFFK